MRRLLGSLLLTAAGSGALFAEAYPRGPEIAGIHEPTGPQHSARVAIRPGGDFAVVWAGYGHGYTTGVFGRHYDLGGTPLGPSFQVSTYTTYPQTLPSVAAGGGGFVVAWTSLGDGSFQGIHGRSFDVNEMPLGPPFPINGYTTGVQQRPAISSDGDSTFVVVWESADQDGSDEGIVGRLIDRRGQTFTPDFVVNTYTTNDQRRPAVAMDASGFFVVAWDGHERDGSGRGVAARLFSASAGALGQEFQVNTYTTGDQLDPSAAIGASGEILITWVSQDQDGSLGGVFARIFDGAGAEIVPEFQVNTWTTGAQSQPSIAADPAGSFTIVWESPGPDGSGLAIAGRRYAGPGMPLGEEFVVNTYATSDQAAPAIAADPRGNLVAAWQSQGQDGSADGIFARLLAGPPLVTDPPAGGSVDCSDPATIRPTISWEPIPYDKYRVFVAWDPRFTKGTRLSSGDRLLTTPSWTPNVKKWRRACAKALEANPSSPVLYIQVLGVDVDVAKADPRRKNAGNVREASVLP